MSQSRARMSRQRFRSGNMDSCCGDLPCDAVVPEGDFLRILGQVVPWQRFTYRLLEYYKGNCTSAGACVGRPPYDPAVLLKMLPLAYLYSLSEGDRDTALYVCPIRGTCVERCCTTATCLPSVFWVSQPPRRHLPFAPCQSARLEMPIDCPSLRVLPGMTPPHEGDRGALDSREVGFIRGSLSARGSSPWGEHDARRHVRSAQPATFCKTGQ